MKVLFISSAEEIGGSEHIFKILLLNFKDRFDVCFLGTKGKFFKNIVESNITSYYSWGLSKLNRNKKKNANLVSVLIQLVLRILVTTMAVFQLVLKIKPDVIHCNNLNSAIRVVFALSITKVLRLFLPVKIKWIYTRHEASYLQSIDKSLDFVCMSLFDKITFVSKATLNSSVASKFGKFQRKSIIIYNGIDTALFFKNQEKREQFRKSIMTDETTCVIASVGRISKSKGSDLLVEAFCQCSAQVPEKRPMLVLIGPVIDEDISFVQKLKEKIVLESMTDKIVFYGTCSEMESTFCGIDIIVAASTQKTSESFGLTLVEGMACGSIAIGSRTGGISEVIDDQKTGFLFDADNRESLEKVLLYVIKNLNTFEALRKNARQSVADKFNKIEMVEKYATIFSGLHS